MEHTTQSTAPSKTIKDWLLVKNDPKKLVQDRFELAKKALSHRHDKWRKIRSMYHGYVHDTAKKKARANFHYHKIFPQIELEAARFVVNYFRHDPFISAMPTQSSSIESASRHESVIQHYLEHAPTFYLEKMRLLKYTGLYGCGFEMPTWRRDVQKVKRQVPVVLYGEQVGVEEIETDEVVYEGLWFKTFAPTDVFPYPYASNISTAPWVILVEFLPISELVDRAKMGIYDLDKVNKVPLNSYLQDEWDFRKQFSQLGQSTPDEDPELICLQHMFSHDQFITLANDDVVIRDVPNLFWHKKIPLVQGVKTLDPDSFWPIGTAQNLMTGQKLVNLYINSMVDQTVSTHWPIWKYRSGSVNPNDLLSMPNHKIGMKSMDDVDVVKMPEMKQDMLAIKAIIEAGMEETTGYFGSQKGTSAGKAQTATSDAIFQSEGNNRIQYDVMTFEELTLIPEARMISKIIQQFMPEEIDVRVNGPGTQFQKLTAEEVRGEFMFKASGSSEALNRAVMQQQLIELFNTAQGASQFVQMPTGEIVPVPVLDTYNALKELYEGYNRNNTDKLLYRPEVFGIPLTNEVLNQFGLPSLPGMDQMSTNPATGALRSQNGAAPLQNMSSSVSEKDIVNNANRTKPVGSGVI